MDILLKSNQCNLFYDQKFRKLNFLKFRIRKYLEFVFIYKRKLVLSNCSIIDIFCSLLNVSQIIHAPLPFISLVIKISIYEQTCHMFEDRVHTNFDAGFYLDHLFSVPTRFQPFRFFNSFAPFLFKSFRPMRKEPRSERNEIAEMHTTYSSVVASKAY